MTWAPILVASAGCFAFKLAGLSVPQRLLSGARTQRVATLLPVALLAALIGLQTFSSGRALALDARLAGLAVAIVAVRFRAPFLLVVALAALTTALVRL
jgi:Branched-chain amino acid transport protein (AzlD)